MLLARMHPHPHQRYPLRGPLVKVPTMRSACFLLRTPHPRWWWGRKSHGWLGILIVGVGVAVMGRQWRWGEAPPGWHGGRKALSQGVPPWGGQPPLLMLWREREKACFCKPAPFLHNSVGYLSQKKVVYLFVFFFLVAGPHWLAITILRCRDAAILDRQAGRVEAMRALCGL